MLTPRATGPVQLARRKQSMRRTTSVIPSRAFERRPRNLATPTTRKVARRVVWQRTQYACGKGIPHSRTNPVVVSLLKTHLSPRTPRKTLPNHTSFISSLLPLLLRYADLLVKTRRHANPTRDASGTQIQTNTSIIAQMTEQPTPRQRKASSARRVRVKLPRARTARTACARMLTYLVLATMTGLTREGASVESARRPFLST